MILVRQLRRFSTEAPLPPRYSSGNHGSWDPQNKIRVISATLGLAGGVGMFFDMYYRRSTKQEIDQAMEKMEAKIEARVSKVEARINELSTTLLHIHQRDRIAAETELRELRKELKK